MMNIRIIVGEKNTTLLNGFENSEENGAFAQDEQIAPFHTMFLIVIYYKCV